MKMTLDFQQLHGPVFTGRERGKRARKFFKLEKITPDDRVDVIIPEDVYTVTSSFFLGLFGESIKDMGLEAFTSVYKFKAPNYLKESIDEWIVRAARDKTDLFK